MCFKAPECYEPHLYPVSYGTKKKKNYFFKKISACDIYSAGVTLCALISQNMPFCFHDIDESHSNECKQCAFEK